MISHMISAIKSRDHYMIVKKTPDGYYAGPDGAWDGNPAGTGR